MLQIKKSIEQGFSGQPGGLFDILTQLQNLTAGIGGEVFFVDEATGSNGYDGKSWDKAFKTIKHASTISDVVIATTGKSEWRNTIFCRGRFSENLTDFGEKVDYIGVGSLDARSKCRITGHHTATDLAGTRFFNFEFLPDSAAPIFIFTDVYGVEFHQCLFQNTESYNTTYALEYTGTACHEIVIANCIFKNDTANDPFETAAIYHNCTYAFGLIIRDNLIEGDIGIDIDTPTVWQGAWVINNYIVAAGMPIDDESDDIVFANNILISTSLAAESTVDWNVKLAAGNISTGTDDTVTLPEIEVRTT